MILTNPQLASSVRARLIDALGLHSPADEARIIVRADGDRVELHGCVRSWQLHEALGRAALATPGVRSVDNQLALLIEPHVAGPPQCFTNHISAVPAVDTAIDPIAQLRCRLRDA